MFFVVFVFAEMFSANMPLSAVSTWYCDFNVYVLRNNDINGSPMGKCGLHHSTFTTE